MANLAHGNNLHWRDATQNARVEIAPSTTILPNTFVGINANGKLVPATATSRVLGFAMKGGASTATEFCSIPYLKVEDGDQFVIATSEAPVVGNFYVLSGHDALGAGSATPTANSVNFYYDGRTFTAQSH